MSIEHTPEYREIVVPEIISGAELELLAGQVPTDESVRLILDKAVLDFPAYPLTINTQNYEVYSRDVHARTTKIEFSILRFLALRADAVQDRVSIMGGAIGYTIGNPHIVDVHLTQINKKMEQTLGIVRPIRNIRGVGFIFDSEPKYEK